MIRPALVTVLIWLIAAPLLAQSQPPTPGRGNSQETEQAEPNSEGVDAGSGDKPSAPVPVTITKMPVVEVQGIQPPQNPGNKRDEPLADWWLLSWSDTVTAVLTLTIAVIAGLQVKRMTAANAHTRTVERGYVRFSAPRLVLMPDNEFRVTTTITNEGHTPADIYERFVDIKRDVLWPHPPRPSVHPNRLEHPRSVLMPNEGADSIARVTWMIRGDGGQVTQNIRSGGEQLTVVGWVTYRDRFGKKHRTGFAQRYHHKPVAGDDGSVVFLPEVSESYEEDLN